mgnify:CR=1 FL=1
MKTGNIFFIFFTFLRGLIPIISVDLYVRYISQSCQRMQVVRTNDHDAGADITFSDADCRRIPKILLL